MTRSDAGCATILAVLSVVAAGCGDVECPSGTKYDGHYCGPIDAGSGDGAMDGAVTDAGDMSSSDASTDASFDASPEDAGDDGGTGTVEPAVAVGDAHACALRSDGTVVCWGSNDAGNLGDGTTTNSPLPVQVRGLGGVGTLEGVREIGAGSVHTCAIGGDERLLCWGLNESGQLGIGGMMNSLVPVAVHGLGGAGTLDGVLAVTAGEDYGCAALAGGSAACWGINAHGKLGDGTTTSRDVPAPVADGAGVGRLSDAKSVAANHLHSCAVLTGGQARCWGLNDDGELGDSTTTESLLPVVVQNGAGSDPLTDVVQIATGGGHTCALTGAGHVMCWGRNDRGQLGDGTMAGSPLPVSVRNTSGSGILTGVSAIAVGASYSCAVLSGGEVVCWGSNSFGQLGDGSTTTRPRPVYVASVGGGGRLTTAQQVSAAGAFTCAALADDRVACWGKNLGGLGDGSSTESHVPVEVSLP